MSGDRSRRLYSWRADSLKRPAELHWFSCSLLQAEALVRSSMRGFTLSTGRMGCLLAETTEFADIRWRTIECVLNVDVDAVSDSPFLFSWMDFSSPE